MQKTMGYKKKDIEMIMKGEKYPDYTVLFMYDKSPLYIKDVDKSIYDLLIDAEVTEFNAILNKYELITNPQENEINSTESD